MSRHGATVDRFIARQALAAVIVAFGPPAGANSLGEAPRTAPPFPRRQIAREFHSGPSSLSGRVVRLIPGGVVVDSAGREIEVSFSRIVDVRKETSVAASAIEVGNDLFINGTDGPPFVTKYVSANVCRIDGVIRAPRSHSG